MTSSERTMGALASHTDAAAPEDVFDISGLPVELFMQVLMLVPAADVAGRCALVCRHWYHVARSQGLWRRRCEEEGRYLPALMGPPPPDFISFYFLNPYRRNLLKNTHAFGVAHWVVQAYLWIQVETTPAGADPIADHVPASELGGQGVQNWVTSFQWGAMSQRVDLLKEGCSCPVLDNVQPPIHVSAWCAARWDCGSQFRLEAKLLTEDGQTVAAHEEEKNMVEGGMCMIWHKVEHTFADYQPGVRYVEVAMSGIDTQFWAGNYGAKFTLPSVRLVFEQSRRHRADGACSREHTHTQLMGL